MPRVKRGVIHTKARRNLLKKTKGYMWGRKSKVRLAHTAVMKAGSYAYRDRRAKKRSARSLWNIKINAGVRPLGISYSRLIDGLKKANITLDRKILATLAEKYPAVLAKVVAAVAK